MSKTSDCAIRVARGEACAHCLRSLVGTSAWNGCVVRAYAMCPYCGEPIPSVARPADCTVPDTDALDHAHTRD